MKNAEDIQREQIIKELKPLTRFIYNDKEQLIIKLYNIREGGTSLQTSIAELYYGRLLDKNGKHKEALKLYKKSLNHFINSEAHEYEVECLCRIGYNIGYFNDKFDKAIGIFRKAINKSKKYRLALWEAKSYGNIGIMYDRKGEPREAIKYLLLALEKKLLTNDLIEIAATYNQLGLAYHALREYAPALEYLYKFLKLSEQTGDRNFLDLAHSNLGMIFNTLGDYPKALEYYLKSATYLKEAPEAFGEAALYHNLGTVYLKLGQLENSFDYNSRAVKLWRDVGNRSFLCGVLINISKIFLKQKNTEDVLPCLEEASEIINDLNLKEEKISNNDTWSQYYQLKNNYEESERCLMDNYNSFKGTDHEKQLLETLEQLYLLNKRKGKTAEALNYFEDFISISKELKNEEATKKSISLQFTYELEKKEKEAEIERLKNVELKKAYQKLELAHNELKETQNELIRKERMAAIGKIASEIAHEVQNPLNFVNNFSDLNAEIVKEIIDEIKANGLTETAYDLIEDLNKNSDSINLNGKRAAGIISQLLELTRKGVDFK